MNCELKITKRYCAYQMKFVFAYEKSKFTFGCYYEQENDKKWTKLITAFKNDKNIDIGFLVLNGGMYVQLKDDKIVFRLERYHDGCYDMEFEMEKSNVAKMFETIEHLDKNFDDIGTDEE